VKLNVEIGGTREEQARLKMLSRVTGRTMKSLLLQEARAHAVQLAQFTGPKKLPKAEQRVEQDVKTVYPAHQNGAGKFYKMLKDAGKLDLANAYWHAVKKRKWAAADRILRGEGVKMGVDEARYEALRNDSGGIPKGTEPQGRATMGQQRRQMRERKKRLGRVKGGWWVAALALGGRVRTRRNGKLVNPLPKWVTRHGRDKSLGSAEILETEDYVQVVLENHVPYADDAIGPRWEVALAKAEQSMSKAIARSLDEIERKMSRRRGRAA
jgi:hypothetical protein